MTGAAQPIEWYLARDNKQYGPLSDVELKKLVELRHLRELDLIWRAGFTDWTPAPAAFPEAFAAAEALPAPAEAAQPVNAPPQPTPPAAPMAPPPAEPAAAPTAPVMQAPVMQAPVHRPAASASVRPSIEPQPAAKIETLSDYRARMGSRMDALAGGAQAADFGSAPAHFAAQAPTEGEQARTVGSDRSRPAARRMWIAPAEVDAQPAPVPGDLDLDPQRFNPRLGYPQVAPGAAARQAPAPGDRGGPAFGEGSVLGRLEPAARTASFDTHAIGGGGPVSRPSDEFHDEEDEDRKPRRPRRIRGLIAILMLMALMAGGGWIALMHPELVKQPLSALGIAFDYITNDTSQGKRSSASASRQQAAVAAKPLPAAAMQGFPDGASSIDEMLQAGHLWQIVKAEFPEWYDERIREAARLVAEKKADEAITKHLVDALITLRRKNADHAFQASLQKLQLIARTFRDNLELLARHSQVACYALISSGEGSRGMITLFREPGYSPALQAGLAAVFEAIAEGRRTPSTTLTARRADYDVLTGELTVLGWKEQELNLFADSQALAKSSPDQVCRMVREWFTAHLAVQDGGVQARLLIELVRPVVAG